MTVLKFGPHMAWGGPGFPAFSWPTTQICMLNRSVPGEHLGNQAIILLHFQQTASRICNQNGLDASSHW